MKEWTHFDAKWHPNPHPLELYSTRNGEVKLASRWFVLLTCSCHIVNQLPSSLWGLKRILTHGRKTHYVSYIMMIGKNGKYKRRSGRPLHTYLTGFLSCKGESWFLPWGPHELYLIFHTPPGCQKAPPCWSVLSLFPFSSLLHFDDFSFMAQHDNKKDPALTLYITTVDYNRRDPVFWIQAKVRDEQWIDVVVLRAFDRA